MVGLQDDTKRKLQTNTRTYQQRKRAWRINSNTIADDGRATENAGAVGVQSERLDTVVRVQPLRKLDAGIAGSKAISLMLPHMHDPMKGP